MTLALRQRPLARVVAGIVRANDGALFDPSDLSTLYQDAAGTIPVTAVEQPVGLMLDKSRGLMLGPELQPTNDLSGFSSAQDAITFNNTSFTTVIEARGVSKQLLTIGKFYSVILSATSTTEITLNTTDSILPTARTQLRVGSGTTIFRADRPFLYVRNTGLGTTTINSLTVKELYGYHATQSITASRPTLSARKNILLATETLATQSVNTLAATYTLSFTGTGSVTLSGTATGTLTGNGTDRVSITFTPTAGTLTLTVSGSVTKAQIELSAVAGPYQRVNTATDYDTDGFARYLRFDGVDDYLNLPYMGLYANGSASVVSISCLNSNSAQAILLSEANSGTAAPIYYLQRHLITSGYVNSFIRNDEATIICDFTDTNTVGIGVVGVKSLIDTGATIKQWDNSGDYDVVNYTRQGTVTLNNTTLGALIYTATISYFNGNLYGLIITKSALTDAKRIACERYLSRKSGVQL